MPGGGPWRAPRGLALQVSHLILLDLERFIRTVGSIQDKVNVFIFPSHGLNPIKSDNHIQGHLINLHKEQG